MTPLNIILDKNAFFPVFDDILINLVKRFSTESLQMDTAVDQFFQLNFEESLVFVVYYKVIIVSVSENQFLLTNAVVFFKKEPVFCIFFRI